MLEQPDLSPVAEAIMNGVNDWFHEKGLDQNDLEDCAGEIADDLLEKGLLWVKS